MLLELCENGEVDGCLRFWESERYFVVVGCSNKILTEVNVNACAAKGIPILRRFSGGGAVLQGPGCLNYSLALRHRSLGIPPDLTASYRFVLGRLADGLAGRFKDVEIAGISDLTQSGRKFSGNAQHRKRFSSLFHGTILYGFDLRLVEDYLRMPSKQPAYRQGRSHEAFLCNLSLAAKDIRYSIKRAWGAEEELRMIPLNRVKMLVDERYGRAEWNFKF